MLPYSPRLKRRGRPPYQGLSRSSHKPGERSGLSESEFPDFQQRYLSLWYYSAGIVEDSQHLPLEPPWQHQFPRRWNMNTRSPPWTQHYEGLLTKNLSLSFLKSFSQLNDHCSHLILTACWVSFLWMFSTSTAFVFSSRSSELRRLQNMLSCTGNLQDVFFVSWSG